MIGGVFRLMLQYHGLLLALPSKTYYAGIPASVPEISPTEMDGVGTSLPSSVSNIRTLGAEYGLTG